MATFDITGTGTHTLTDGTTRVFVEVLSVGPGATVGSAYPASYFRVALLRFLVGSFSGRVLGVDALEAWYDVPAGSTAIGAGLFPGATLRVTEEVSTAPPPGTVSRFDNSHVPSATDTDVADETHANLVSADISGYQIVGLRYYRPSGDTSVNLFDFAVYDMVTTATVWSETAHTMSFGWNEWSISPINMTPTHAYGIAVLSLTGRLRCNESGGWGGGSIAHLDMTGCAWESGSAITFPTNGCDNDWLGTDFVIQPP